MTRLGIKLESTAPEADALTTRPFEFLYDTLNGNQNVLQLQINQKILAFPPSKKSNLCYIRGRPTTADLTACQDSAQSQS